MKLDGVHHVTAITGDAPQNLDFYSRVLGLRLVKKTVNQDDPTVYHLFYADDRGSPGSDLTFFEYPGATQGRAGAGVVHRVVCAERLQGVDLASERESGRLRFSDPEGMGLELTVVDTADDPLVATHPEIPVEHALQGFDGVRAYAHDPSRSAKLLGETLGFRDTGGGTWEARGGSRGSFYAYDTPPDEPGIGGAGTVHHVAWASELDDEEAWQKRVAEAGARPTPIIDRYYFRSIYFREPSGVLFEIATKGPGFSADEDPEHLGERLSLPPNYESLRSQLEQVLTPLK
jgi:glyoxalase family protein